MMMRSFSSAPVAYDRLHLGTATVGRVGFVKAERTAVRGINRLGSIVGCGGIAPGKRKDDKWEGIPISCRRWDKEEVVDERREGWMRWYSVCAVTRVCVVVMWERGKGTSVNC